MDVVIKMSDAIQQLRQIHKQALAELNQQKRRIRAFPADYTDECNECWQAGYEEASEEYENLVDDITRLLRDIDITEAQERTPIVSEKQPPLFS